MSLSTNASKSVRLAIVALSQIGIFAAVPAYSNEPSLAKGRALAQSFGRELQVTLQGAMREGGPIAALTVCKDRAPQIAAELSRQSGAKVRRTSRRFRNPDNAPQHWQTTVLEQFESDMTVESPLPEYFERGAEGTRYMKAIRMQPICLLCHGSTLADDVSIAVNELYSDDRATGYAIGELRGAFSITWPIQADSDPKTVVDQETGHPNQ